MKCVKCGQEREGKKQCAFCVKEYKQKYRQNNKEKIAAGNKVYYENNKQEIYKQRNSYNSNRYNSEISFRLRKICSNRIYMALRDIRGSKGGSMVKYLPYTMSELKNHIEKQFEPWMTWQNYGIANYNKRTWQIDHIIPQSALLYSSMKDDNFKKCWALENLRPLETFLNIKKSNKKETS